MANQFGYHCPECNDDEEIEVVAKLWVRLIEDGTTDSVVNNDQEWDDTSAAHCTACGWTRTVGDLKQVEEGDDEGDEKEAE